MIKCDIFGNLHINNLSNFFTETFFFIYVYEYSS